MAYSRADSGVASLLARRLKGEGWSVFMDVQTPVGKRWDKKIQDELVAAKAVVALWSTSSCDSNYVLDEADFARQNEVLFPAFIERVGCPYGFGRIYTADLVGWAGDKRHRGLARLLTSHT